MTNWLEHPALITLSQATRLSGLSEHTFYAMIGERIIDVIEEPNGDCLIDKDNLELALDAATELSYWED